MTSRCLLSNGGLKDTWARFLSHVAPRGTGVVSGGIRTRMATGTTSGGSVGMV